MLSSCTWQNHICWNLRVWLVAKWACNKMKLLLLAVRLLQQDEVVAWFSRKVLYQDEVAAWFRGEVPR